MTTRAPAVLTKENLASYITQLDGCTSTKIATTPPTCRRNLVTRLSQNDVSSRVAHDAVASDHLVGRADDVDLWFGNVSSIFGLVFIFHLSSQFLNWSSLRTVFRLQQSPTTWSYGSFEISHKSERQTIVMSRGVGFLMLKIEENYEEGEKKKRNNRNRALPSKSKRPSGHFWKY